MAALTKISGFTDGEKITYLDFNKRIVLHLNEEPESKKNVPLKKDGTPKKTHSNKQKGKSSEVQPYEIKDAKALLDYLIDNEKWIHYLMFTLSCNTARRNGDIRALTWNKIFNPATGSFWKDTDLKEEKTGKTANIRLNEACKFAVKTYCEKTGCDPSRENYTLPVFLQLSGTHKGRVLSYEGHRIVIKEAAKKIGLDYNVATHSARKFFGMVSKMIHKNDPNALETLQKVFNHSSTKITTRYIGDLKKNIDSWYEDMSSFFNEYIVGDKRFVESSAEFLTTLPTHDIFDIIDIAFEAGKRSTENGVETENIKRELYEMVQAFANK